MIVELLRKLIDLLDSVESQSATGNVMVPPLQSKLELLKKSVGVDNVYDDNDADELTIIRKNAGISAQIEASEDNDITG
jgi:Fic family protein